MSWIILSDIATTIVVGVALGKPGALQAWLGFGQFTKNFFELTKIAKLAWLSGHETEPFCWAETG